MLLLIDIGNTNTTIGFSGNGEINYILRLKTIIDGRDAEEYFFILNGFMQQNKIGPPEGAVLCSVVPDVTPFVMSALKKIIDAEPVNVNYKLKTGLKFLIKNKEELGADRIANATAAHKLYKGNVIVVDFGTATTFCVITEEGEYAGGAIMPGIAMSARALAGNTAKLPLVELKPPESVPGKNTRENISAGVILGHAGAVERIVNEIKMDIGKDFSLVATGGLVDSVKSYTKIIDYVDPLLTLEGLKFIYELNS